jgi:hypothetical protein
MISLRPRRGLVLGAASAIAVLSLGGQAQAQVMADIVKAICLSAFQAEMRAAGKSAPAGMAEYACDCVVDRLSEGSSLDQAQDTCRQMASKRYHL